MKLNRQLTCKVSVIVTFGLKTSYSGGIMKFLYKLYINFECGITIIVEKQIRGNTFVDDGDNNNITLWLFLYIFIYD